MALTTVDQGLLGTYAQYTGFKNRIINGDMRIDQRNNGASVTTSDSYPVDRFRVSVDMDGTFSSQQSSVAPSGFVNSLLFTTNTADASLSATQYAAIIQNIEGFNIADFGWGTSAAQAVTLSFWVRSSLTGTFGGTVKNSAVNRSYAFTYTISAANIWEYKTVTIPGDTSGTWLTTNGIGIRVAFGLGVGSTYSGTAGSWSASNLISATGATSVVGTSGATFYITGVQLEAGSTATSFDRRDYGRELIMCQRYCFVLAPSETNIRAATSGNYTGTTAYVTTYLPVSLRGSISVTVSSASDFKTEELDGGQQTTTGIGLNVGNGNTPITLSVTVGSSLANPVNLLTGNTSAKITYSSEL